MLREIADRIRRALRGDDWVARYGGEEICIVMRGVDMSLARAVFDRVRRTVSATPIALPSGGALPVTVSIGVAIQGARDESMVALVERASAHLLLAKRAGRDRVAV